MSNETKLEKIYTKYKALKEQADKDCKFNRSEIENSFDSTSKKIWWINQKTEWQKVFREFERQRKEQYKKTYEFYHTEFPIKLNSKEEYQLYIESDPNYINIYTICLVVKEVIQYIDSVLDILKDRAWEVKNFIEYQKFVNGF